VKKLSHYDQAGSPRMVDVSAKQETRRSARAHAFVKISRAVLKKLPANPKGNPLEIARIAGIGAAKRTSELIPLCHPLMLSHADVEVTLEASGVRIVASATTTAQTGVEMEALTAAAVAALTVYDMTKALDKSIEIQDLYLLEKTGGKSGDFRRGHLGAAILRRGDLQRRDSRRKS
jgi:cyclic pyranopterin phosphate synthase